MIKNICLILTVMLNLSCGAEEHEVQVAEKNILALDMAMRDTYDKVQKGYKENFFKQHPVILALFNISGGQLTLFRPGKVPLQAPPVPIDYQLLKAVSHSSLAVFQIANSHLATVADGSWRKSMIAFRNLCQAGLDGLPQLDIGSDTRENLQNTLKRNIEFMDMSLNKGFYTKDDIVQFILNVKPYLVKNIRQSAHIQVSHWMQVVKDWKELLGPDWEKTYGVSDTLYMLRQNNILFSILAQFFGKEALNTKLFLFETTDFMITPEQLLDLLIRTVADRSISQAFFGNYYLMDNDITGGDAREAIQREGKKLGIPVLLPPAVPFHSTEWPWRIDPSQGKGPATIDQIPK